MAKWEITLPYRDRDAKLDPAAIADDAAESIADPEEQAVVRALGMELFLAPHLETVGDALDALEAASPAARRALLDNARQRLGLPTTGEQDADDAYRDANRNRGGGSLRDSQGRVEARCSAPGCSRYEPDRRFPAVAGEPGLAVKVNAACRDRRRDQATTPRSTAGRAPSRRREAARARATPRRANAPRTHPDSRAKAMTAWIADGSRDTRPATPPP
jgi:hypothetical protein